MKYIELKGIKGKGKFAIVDDEDFEELNKYRWYCRDRNYVFSRLNKTKSYSPLVYMHRYLLLNKYPLKFKKGIVVDHINRNSLDNRKSNIRICSIFQNNINKCLHKNNTSGYKGVKFSKRDNFWMASISENYKFHHLGCFKTKKEAAVAYNEAAKKYFGEFTYLNVL